MIHCKIYVENECDYLPEEVYIDIFLPCLPHINDTISIGENLLEELQNKAKSKLEIGRRYSRWLFGKSRNINNSNNITIDNLKDLSFGDAQFVTSINFVANESYVQIEINDKMASIR